jgi:hypothetical protein
MDNSLKLKKKAADRRLFRSRHPEKVKETLLKWYNNNQDKVIAQRLKKYGITTSDYQKILSSQNGCCAICGISETKLNYRLCVDHCHITNIVRGLLCYSCNQGIGFLNDDINKMESAVIYLTKNENVIL